MISMPWPGFCRQPLHHPGTIASVDFNKGPYTAAKGDFATTGFADFNTRNSLPYNLSKWREACSTPGADWDYSTCLVKQPGKRTVLVCRF